jgi:hypothetical protein
MDMIDHGWIRLDEAGDKQVCKIEQKPPQLPENVKRLADGSLSVLPIVYETDARNPFQRPGPVTDTFTEDAIIRRTPAEPRPLDEVQAIRLRQVREQARRRILAIAPEYRQVNGLRDLQGTNNAARAEAVEMFDRIDAIRAASNEAQAAIMAAETAEAAATVEPVWPD